MRVGAVQQSAGSRHRVGFVHWVVKPSKTRVCVLLLLSLALGFWIRPQGYHWPILRWVETHLNERYIKRYTQSLISAPRLPTLSIDVKFKHVEKLRRKRQEALDLTILIASDEDFVPAKLRFEGRTISAKLRLKGDMSDHWGRGSKWSFRIKIKGDDHLLGMRRFSIQHPRTRTYLFEWGFLEMLRKEEILAPRYQFINVVFNGEDRGVYALEEHFSKELLESLQRREGVIIKPDESELFAGYVLLDRHLWSALWEWGPTLSHLDTFRSDYVDANPLLSKQRDEALGLLRAFQEGRRRPSEIFDVEVMSRFMAITDLWVAWHNLQWRNSRYYYNPITARLEPIGFDAHPFFFKGPRERLLWIDGEKTVFMQDPVLAEAYVRQLQRIGKQSFLKAFKQEYEEKMQELLIVLSRESASDTFLRLPWNDLALRHEYLRKVLEPKQMVLAFNLEHTAPNTDGKAYDLIEVRNVLDLPVEVVGLQVGEGPIIPAKSAWRIQPEDPGTIFSADQAVLLPVPGSHVSSPYVHFAVPCSEESALYVSNEARTIYVHTRLIGHERVIRSAVLHQPQAIKEANFDEHITVKQALAKHEFLEQGDDATELWIKSGTWKVHEDLVIPQDIRLRAGPDTVLKFGENVVLVAQGPVKLRGTPDQPVILESLNATWPGMVVMKADRPSVLEHVTIRGTRGIARRGWILTGGVTFYKSPVLIKYCHFENSLGEDGLNIIRTEFDLRGTRFSHCASDAFDGDFATGKVQGCEFTDVRADGLDLSGSEVVVAQSVFDQIGDKAISVGERSTARIRSISVSQSRFGVVSKDCSKVSVDRSTFRQVQYGLAAFEKKPEFGPAHLEAHNVRMDRVAKPSLVQTDSTMTIDGKTQPTEHLDVESLYRAAANRKDGGGV